MASSASKRDPGDSARGDLRREDVEAVFREFLGRAATPGDVDVWMQIGSLRTFLDGVLTSEEYAERLKRRAQGEEAHARGSFLNCSIKGWERFTRPPGDVSPDGVVIVGQSGHLFIYGGTNSNVPMYRGQVEMAAGWLDEWRTLMTKRLARARDAERRLVCLVVPEKLAVYADFYPLDLSSSGSRPVLRLLGEGGLPLVYPIEALRDARDGGDTYLLTDSHLTPRGNRIMAEAVMSELGVSPALLPEVEESDATLHLGAGDLGLHFNPPLLEVMHPMSGSSQAAVVSDNREQVARVGGYIGSMRVFRREDAPDERTVVVFGDSYGFGGDAYQGLSWWLAQVFREVHFVWVPFGWDPKYLDSVKADLVVCQTAERFIARVPRFKVNARSLAKETIKRHWAVTEERIFTD
jgi:alginate O-acetyltransferase complex protein AlgJ